MSWVGWRAADRPHSLTENKNSAPLLSPLSSPRRLAEALEDPNADGLPGVGGPGGGGGGAPPPAANYGDYGGDDGYGDAYGDYEKGQVSGRGCRRKDGSGGGERERGEIGSPRVAGAASPADASRKGPARP